MSGAPSEQRPREVANRKLGVAILGASTFPHFPQSLELDKVSFAQSAAAFRGLITAGQVSVFEKPAVLDLFDASDDPSTIIPKVRTFLQHESGLTDVLFYYCGHGSFLADRTYFLMLRATEADNEAFTGLPLRQMRLALETQLMMKRVFLVLDCCFAGQAAKEWMSTGIGHVIEDQIFQSFPRRGTALIAASARSSPAIAPEQESLTMFTGVLIKTISQGIAGARKELSFRVVIDAVRANISEHYGSAAVVPEIHAPQQEEGDISFAPFFVNQAFVPPEAAAKSKAEQEIVESAVADLDRPLPRVREAAITTLEELLSGTRTVSLSGPQNEPGEEQLVGNVVLPSSELAPAGQSGNSNIGRQRCVNGYCLRHQRLAWCSVSPSPTQSCYAAPGTLRSVLPRRRPP
ncbi:MAG TPA: hypothetical protein VEN29_12620 [Casimicrobiaceae bacterium]|nr:hypothetical protein [Casimicrobiaceae bacterium]